MSIPAEHSNKYFFHFSHLQNLDSILKNGILSTNKKNESGLTHIDVAEESIQERRSNMDVTCGPLGKVHDYVPFYWSTTNAMFLSIVNSKNYDQPFMIFFAISVKKIAEEHVVFTDASANTIVPPNFYSNPEDLNKLDWKAINNKSWSKGSSDEVHKKMAEVLINKQVAINEIDTIVVWNKWVKDKVIDIFKDNGIEPPKIDYSPFNGIHLFFTKFMIKGMENNSLVTGPIMLKNSFLKCSKTIKENRKKSIPGQVFLFNNIEDAIAQIDANFSIVKELDGIFELKTDNKMHNENVSDHTLCVVEELEKLEYYTSLGEGDKNILKLSAYLHDIGKGPKSKWDKEIQKVYPDHPADAPEMLERILVEDIESISDYEIEMICLLVTYHDLIGEIIGKGRDEEQLKSIIKTEKEFDMLSTLNLADVTAINTFFKWSYNGGITKLRTRVLAALK